jgi:hypothetical protein
MPIGFIDRKTIANGNALIILKATKFEFGVLCSTMQMAWMRNVAGRMKGDYQYSNQIVYNNFPWPFDLTARQKQKIETAAQGVLDARAQFPDSSLADLYDPLTMSSALVKAHKQLDAAYGKCNFKNDAERVAFLFALYQQYTSLLPVEKTLARKGRKKS